MPLNKNIRICTHIKVNGVRCGSPSLHSEVFCYFHQRMIRGVATPPKSRLHPIALIEDTKSIQVSLMEVINALVRNTIDVKRASLILRALHIAVRNSPRVHFDTAQHEMVTEVPDYPAAPAQEPIDQALAQAGALQNIAWKKRYEATYPEEARMTKEARAKAPTSEVSTPKIAAAAAHAAPLPQSPASAAETTPRPPTHAPVPPGVVAAPANFVALSP